MRLLLDTHVWLWSVLEPERLPRPLAGDLEDRANELWLSAISAWETMLLAERGRIELDDDPGPWIERTLRQTPLRDAPITREIAARSRSLDLPNSDPADRFIAATAAVQRFVLVTADARLQRSGQYEVLAIELG